MQYEPTTPQQDGFSMPAEFSPHQGCILIWPERPGSWKNGAAAARKAFRSVIAAIAESETVYVAVNPHSRPSAERMLAGMANVRLLASTGASTPGAARSTACTPTGRRTMPSRAACWICSAFAAMMPHRS